MAAAPAGWHFGASSRIATVRKLRTSRRWLSRNAPARQRGVQIHFWLARARTVVFYVDQLSPDCRYVGKFLVRGRSGRNIVRFRGRIGGRVLEPGTYRLTARPRGEQGRRLAGVTIVVLEHPPGGAGVVAAARSQNTCPGGTPPSVLVTETLAAATGASGDGEAGGGDGLTKSGTAGVAGVASTSGRSSDTVLPGPLGAAADSIQSAAEAIPPVFFALAALAVVLLALASMPRSVQASRAGETLVHHRGTLALAGVGMLIGAVLSFTLMS